MNENQETPAVSPEQAADLQRLQQAATEGQAAPLAEGQEEPAPAVDLAGELSALTLAFVAMASPLLPSLAVIYTPDTTQAAASAVAAVCEKHGWLQDGIAQGYGEEVAAAVVLVPLAIATAQGVKHDLAELERKNKPQAVEAPAVVEGEPVVSVNGSVQGWQPGGARENG